MCSFTQTSQRMNTLNISETSFISQQRIKLPRQASTCVYICPHIELHSVESLFNITEVENYKQDIYKHLVYLHDIFVHLLMKKHHNQN